MHNLIVCLCLSYWQSHVNLYVSDHTYDVWCEAYYRNLVRFVTSEEKNLTLSVQRRQITESENDHTADDTDTQWLYSSKTPQYNCTSNCMSNLLLLPPWRDYWAVLLSLVCDWNAGCFPAKTSSAVLCAAVWILIRHIREISSYHFSLKKGKGLVLFIDWQ